MLAFYWHVSFRLRQEIRKFCSLTQVWPPGVLRVQVQAPQPLGHFKTENLEYLAVALADVAQWIERWPANQRVIGSIPTLGHMPGLQAGSPVRGV